MADIYRGIVPFVILQILGIVAIGLFPSLVTYLPELFFGR
jgi:TRAP-type mannitol/chloroaromatic compound transport system permease large subunit